MHEVGIVNGILDTVIRAARGAGASRAVLVTLRIGDMTEVVREALDFAWETFRDEDPLTRGCELAVEEVTKRVSGLRRGFRPRSLPLSLSPVWWCQRAPTARPRARYRKYRNRNPRRLAR